MNERRRPDRPPGVAPVESKRELDADDIARRAHELYEARGRGEGRDEDDWLQAEEELRARPPRTPEREPE